jgi:hypothetical protein
LEKAELDKNYVDQEGKNPVHWTVNPLKFGSYENDKILRMLVSKKFDLNHKDFSGKTPLYYAQF